MNLDEEMKKFKERGTGNPISLSKKAAVTASSLDQAAVRWGYKMYWNKKFQKLAELEKLNRTEKDRIFNELILAGETVIMLTLEAKDLRQDDNFKDYLLMVKDEIPNAHDDLMKEVGIERKYRKLWKKLINMRYDEYSQNIITAREAMIEYESKEKILEVSDLTGINLFLPPFTVAVGVHKHILRGKTKGKDDLFKLIIKNLTRFYTNIRITLEGEEIKGILKLKMKLRHLLRDLKESLGKE